MAKSREPSLINMRQPLIARDVETQLRRDYARRRRGWFTRRLRLRFGRLNEQFISALGNAEMFTHYAARLTGVPFLEGLQNGAVLLERQLSCSGHFLDLSDVFGDQAAQVHVGMRQNLVLGTGGDRHVEIDIEF